MDPNLPPQQPPEEPQIGPDGKPIPMETDHIKIIENELKEINKNWTKKKEEVVKMKAQLQKFVTLQTQITNKLGNKFIEAHDLMNSMRRRNIKNINYVPTAINFREKGNLSPDIKEIYNDIKTNVKNIFRDFNIKDIGKLKTEMRAITEQIAKLTQTIKKEEEELQKLDEEIEEKEEELKELKKYKKVMDMFDKRQEKRDKEKAALAAQYADQLGGKRKRKKPKKPRKHKGINQKTGKLKKGYRYSGKKLKSGMAQIIKINKKK